MDLFKKNNGVGVPNEVEAEDTVAANEAAGSAPEETMGTENERFDFGGKGPDDQTAAVTEFPTEEEEETDKEEQEHESRRERRERKRMQLMQPWDIVWSWILMNIPVLGWIVAILWAVGLCKKKQRKYLARAFLIILLFVNIIAAVVYLFYTLVFRLGLDDLPTVITAVYNWIWNIFSTIFKK